ncbi:MAG: ribose 5-phosphate isomerase B [Pyrinomonadaceae bacterium]|nr:ribose 5-phosphate isomerase B [Pyrinomonadaceae bacterium]
MENETRERVKALVKEALKNAPLEAKKDESTIEHFVVNSLRNEAKKEFDRDESAKNLITEDDLRGLENGAKIRIAENAKLTPLANDLVREKGIELIRKTSQRGSIKLRSVAIGCDHGGFEMKEELKKFLHGLGLNVRDFGTNSKDAVDYPDFAHAVAVAVSNRNCDVGIIIDGAGIGSAMTANKVPNVRAAACYNVALAKNSREHNGANVLTLGSGQNKLAEVKEIVQAWLSSEISEDRHKKRVGKIDAIEKQYKK